MSLIPDDQLKVRNAINFAPMVDFLFIVIVVFATLAITRNAVHDKTIDLVQTNEKSASSSLPKQQELKTINLTVTPQGKYKWYFDEKHLILTHPSDLKQMIAQEIQLGHLSADETQTQVLLHIDKNAQWESIANLIFTIREIGISVYPVYENDFN